MTVKTENIDLAPKQIEDDISQEITKEKLAELKAKLGNKSKDNGNKMEKRALKIGCLGSGQAGGKIVSQMYKLGYDCVAINTAQQDLQLLELPETNKLYLSAGLDGAAKDRNRGAEIALQYKDNIKQIVEKQLSDCQIFLLVSSLGGGSGAGSLPTLVDILNELGKPTIAMLVLPLTSEDGLTQSNSFYALAEMSKFLQTGKLANIIVVDNSKIESIYSNVSQLEFYDKANEAIVAPLDQMNKLSASPSRVKAVDHTELAKTLVDAQGLSIFGEIIINNYKADDENNEYVIAKAVMENMENNLLVEGFDISQAKYAAFYVVASSNTWKNIKSSSINYAMALLDDNLERPAAVFKGLYEGDIEDGTIKIISIFTGLALPEQRVAGLRKQADEFQAKMKDKDSNRNVNLNIDTGQDKNISKVQEIKNKISKNSSTFGKFLGGNTIDKRGK